MKVENENKTGKDTVEIGDIKRLIARRPLAARDSEGYEYAICPCCCTTVSNGENFFQFCPDCGQKIDWKIGEEDDPEKDRFPNVDAKPKFAPKAEWNIPEGAINFTSINCRPEDRFLISCGSCGKTSIVESTHVCYCPVCGPDTITPIVARKVTKVLVKD